MGRRSNDGCCSERLGSDDGLGKGQWEVERATLEGRPKGHVHDDESTSEVKEELKRGVGMFNA